MRVPGFGSCSMSGSSLATDPPERVSNESRGAKRPSIRSNLARGIGGLAELRELGEDVVVLARFLNLPRNFFSGTKFSRPYAFAASRFLSARSVCLMLSFSFHALCVKWLSDEIPRTTVFLPSNFGRSFVKHVFSFVQTGEKSK